MDARRCRAEREGGRSGGLTGNTGHAGPGKIPYRNSPTMAADALRQSACAAPGSRTKEQRPCCSPERYRICRCRTRPACHAPPARRGSSETNQMPIRRRRTVAASTGSSHHRRKPIACTAVRGPQTRRAPSRRFPPAHPNNRAAGLADAGWEDDGGDPATAHGRSSNRARSSNRDAQPAFPPPASGQSRRTARARSTTPQSEPQRVADGNWVCRDVWKAGSRARFS
jgi:hypothetical protein